MMPIDVPVQTVDAPVVENQVYVIPGVNWDMGRSRIADSIEIADDPEHFYSLEMVDAPELAPADASSAKLDTINPVVKKTPAKRKVLVKRKHVKPKKAAPAPSDKVCKCSD